MIFERAYFDIWYATGTIAQARERAKAAEKAQKAREEIEAARAAVAARRKRDEEAAKAEAAEAEVEEAKAKLEAEAQAQKEIQREADATAMEVSRWFFRRNTSLVGKRNIHLGTRTGILGQRLSMQTNVDERVCGACSRYRHRSHRPGIPT